MKKTIPILIVICFAATASLAQTMSVEEYQPRSTLVVPQHVLTKAKYPFIDVHTHYDATMSRERLAKHPKTIFIAAHLDWLGGNLARLGELLDKYPNMYTEIGGVLAELGRQPRFAREWFVRYQDRVLFGKDITEAMSEYHVYFRVLETADEYFDYYRRRHAFWKMYGLELPDQVLRKLYYKNALRIIPGIDASEFPR